MPTTFTPRFVDLVRCTCSTVGTGNLVLGAAVAGFTSFAATLSVGDRFYYSVAGIDKPAEAEIGRGTLLADGSISREAMAGALTNFSLGQKTVSLVAGAEWFRKASAGAIDTATLATRDKSDLGAAINELAKLSPLFSELGTTRVPLSVRRIFTAGRTMVGQAPGAYVRDPDQGALTAIGQQLVDALPVGEQAAATAAVKAILDRVRAADADGQYWVIDDEGCPVHAGHFGAVADGVFNFAVSAAASGTDNSAAIQALIDWRVYLRAGSSSAGRECLIPPGKFHLSKGLQLGYGDDFYTVVLRGAGPSFAGSSGGTTLICDFEDHPGISIQGGRNSHAADLTMVCPRGYNYLYAKQFSDGNNAALSNFGIDDRYLASWFDPARPTMSPYLRYNPFAGIAIDPYAGTQPAAAAAWAGSTVISVGQYRTANGKLYIAKAFGTTAASGAGPSAVGDSIVDGTVTWTWVGPATLSTSYPAAAAAAFLPASSRVTYRRHFSSNFPISNVRIYGFTVGVAVQPCDADGNGDFTDLSLCEISFCPILLSVGNGQSRSVAAYRMTGQIFHTGIATNRHGRQIGRLGGIFTDCSWSNCEQLIDISETAYAGPHTFKNCYVEDLRRIGTVQYYGTASGNPIIFEGCSFVFVHDRGNGKRGVPLFLLGNRLSPYGAASPSSSFVFRDCSFENHLGLVPMLAYGVQFENSKLFGAESYSGFTTQARARAYNTLAGGLVMPRLQTEQDQLIRYQAVNETTLSADINLVTARENRLSSRDRPASIYTPSLSPANGRTEAIANPTQLAGFDKGATSAASLAGRTLTFTYPQNITYARSNGIAVGGIILDHDSGMIFIVQALTGTGSFTVTAELQNGYSYSAAGAIAYEVPFTAASGTYWTAAGGIFTPSYPLFADLSAASFTLANAQRGDGWTGYVTGGAGDPVQAGDQPYADDLADPVFNTVFKVVSTGAAAITLSGAPTITAAKRRLPLWVRGS